MWSSKFVGRLFAGTGCFLSLSLTTSAEHSRLPQDKYDLVVIGGTPGGIACAIRAAREGLTVLLVNHNYHLGGFLTSGAGGWEAPYDGHRSPLFSEILKRTADHYSHKYGPDSPQYRASLPQSDSRKHIDRPKVEPHVAEQLFEEMIAAEHTITVLRRYYVHSVARQDRKLLAVTLTELNGEKAFRVKADTFADATYEGDLLAAAGVSYQLGREPRTQYGEPHAGVVYTSKRSLPDGQAGFSKDAAEGRLDIRHFHHASGPQMPSSTGEGDNSVMAYNYRLILTKNPQNKIPIKKPENYDADAPKKVSNGSYIPSLPNLIEDKPNVVPNIQNDKIGWNGGRLIGPQNEYPEGDWATREKISRLYLDTMLSLLWYYQNDPAARPEDREYWKEYGLAADEFVKNGNLPYEIYVREGRRLVGRHVFTEHDGLAAPGLGRTPIHKDSVAITDWPMDSVACVERGTEGGSADGIFFLSEESRPAQVPYRSLLAKEVDNLLAPVPLSASHVGWGCLRLEPVWMQTGEAAGFAAALAKSMQTTPGELDSDLLLRTLIRNHFMVSFFNDFDASSSDPWVAAAGYFGTKGFFAEYDAKPDELLDMQTARCWMEIFRQLQSREDFDPMKLSVKLPRGEEPSITRSEFIRLLNDVTKNGKRNTFGENPIDKETESDPITRREACSILYEILENRPEIGHSEKTGKNIVGNLKEADVTLSTLNK